MHYRIADNQGNEVSYGLLSDTPTDPDKRERDVQTGGFVIGPLEANQLPLQLQCLMNNQETPECTEEIDFVCTEGDYLGDP
jgi:hypothetical protein